MAADARVTLGVTWQMRPTIFLDIDGVLNRTTVRREDGLVMRSVRSLTCLPRLAPLLSLRRT